MIIFLVGKDTLKISEAYINAFPAFSCPLFASKNPIVQHCNVTNTYRLSQIRKLNKSESKINWQTKYFYVLYSFHVHCTGCLLGVLNSNIGPEVLLVSCQYAVAQHLRSVGTLSIGPDKKTNYKCVSQICVGKGMIAQLEDSSNSA